MDDNVRYHPSTEAVGAVLKEFADLSSVTFTALLQNFQVSCKTCGQELHIEKAMIYPDSVSTVGAALKTSLCACCREDHNDPSQYFAATHDAPKQEG